MKTTRPGENKSENNRPILSQGAGRLFFMYLIDKCYNTRYHYNKGKEVTVSHIHKHHPFPQDSERAEAVLPAALVSILLSMYNMRGCKTLSLYSVSLRYSGILDKSSTCSTDLFWPLLFNVQK